MKNKKHKRFCQFRTINGVQRAIKRMQQSWNELAQDDFERIDFRLKKRRFDTDNGYLNALYENAVEIDSLCHT